MRAREIRGDFTFGEEILDIADDGTNDWIEAKNGGAPRVNKEVVLRSKLRIEARQFHMSRLQPKPGVTSKPSTSKTIGRF